MKSSWPRVDVCITRMFDAEHSLPWQPERHRHSYWMDAGYFHEVNPHLNGVTKELSLNKIDIEDVIVRIEGKYLNDELPCISTLEMTACWILANLPIYWDYVVLRSYGCMTVRVERRYMTTEWMEKLRARSDRQQQT